MLIALVLLVGFLIIRLDGDDDDNTASPLGQACAIVNGLDASAPPSESLTALKGLAELDDAVDKEGLDPSGDLTRVPIAATAFETGAIDGETLGNALRRFIATCENAGFDADPTKADLGGGTNSGHDADDETTTTRATTTNEDTTASTDQFGDPCIGVSGCAFDNGIDFASLRSELADYLVDNDGIPATADEIDCDGGSPSGPNRVGYGDSFDCFRYPGPEGAAIIHFSVTVTAFGQYTWSDEGADT